MPDPAQLPPHPARLPIDVLVGQCTVSHTRRRGPGGQHRNKVATAVVVIHEPTGCRAEASERRSQTENRKVAFFRLRTRLALEVRRPAAPARSDLWQCRSGSGRLAVNPEHDDFPALLAECLDVVAACDFDLTEAALRSSVTASQLAKFLKEQPRGWQWVNEQRKQRGLRPWH